MPQAPTCFWVVFGQGPQYQLLGQIQELKFGPTTDTVGSDQSQPKTFLVPKAKGEDGAFRKPFIIDEEKAPNPFSPRDFKCRLDLAGRDGICILPYVSAAAELAVLCSCSSLFESS